MDRNETAGWEIGADRQGRLNVYPLSSSFSFFFIFRLYVYTLRALLSFIPSLAYTPSHLLIWIGFTYTRIYCYGAA